MRGAALALAVVASSCGGASSPAAAPPAAVGNAGDAAAPTLATMLAALPPGADLVFAADTDAVRGAEAIAPIWRAMSQAGGATVGANAQTSACVEAAWAPSGNVVGAASIDLDAGLAVSATLLMQGVDVPALVACYEAMLGDTETPDVTVDFDRTADGGTVRIGTAERPSLVAMRVAADADGVARFDMAFGIELEPPQPTGSTPIDAGLLDLLRDHDAWVWKTPGTAFWPAVKMALVSLDADDDHARLFVGIDGPAAATARAFAATAVDMVRPLVERITTDSDDGDFQLEVDMTAAQIQRMVTLAPMAMDAFRSYTKRGGKVAPVPVIAPAGGSTP